MVKPVKHKFCVYIFWASHALARDISNNLWGRKCRNLMRSWLVLMVPTISPKRGCFSSSCHSSLIAVAHLQLVIFYPGDTAVTYIFSSSKPSFPISFPLAIDHRNYKNIASIEFL